MEDKEVTTNELMNFLQENMVTKEEFFEFKDEVNQRFEDVNQRFESVDDKFEDVNQKLNQTKLDFIDALDDKLGDLKGDLTVMMRKEDKKLVALIEILRNKKVLDEDEVMALLALQPFPQT